MIKCFMLDYKYINLQIKGHDIKEFKRIIFLGYIQMYTSVNSDVSQEGYSLELIDLP